MEDIAKMSDRELLGELIGQAAASRIQKGTLLRVLQAGIAATEVRALHVA
jgi:hypothetical protein